MKSRYPSQIVSAKIEKSPHLSKKMISDIEATIEEKQVFNEFKDIFSRIKAGEETDEWAFSFDGADIFFQQIEGDRILRIDFLKFSSQFIDFIMGESGVVVF